MEVLANERTGPVALEIRKTLEEWKLGMTWNQALDNLSRRVPVLDVAIFVAAVKLHIRTGGKLGEVLSRLAESMRESGAIRGEVRGMAAQGKATGTVLTLLPVAIAVMIFIVNPQQMMILFTHPYGKNLIAAAIVCLILAHFIIRKIVEIKT
jgi:tight adherence protein B